MQSQIAESRARTPKLPPKSFTPSSDIVFASDIPLVPVTTDPSRNKPSGPSIPGTPAIPLVASIRSKIEAEFTNAVTGAADHLAAVERTRADASGILNKLFNTCEILEEQAKNDRKNIEKVRGERDMTKLSLDTMDTRLASYSREVSIKDNQILDMGRQLQSMQEALDAAQRLQSVIDSRHTNAVMERSQAKQERDVMETQMTLANEDKAKAEKAMDKAFAEVDEIQGKLSDVEAEKEDLKQRIAALQSEVEELRGRDVEHA